MEILIIAGAEGLHQADVRQLEELVAEGAGGFLEPASAPAVDFDPEHVVAAFVLADDRFLRLLGKRGMASTSIFTSSNSLSIG